MTSISVLKPSMQLAAKTSPQLSLPGVSRFGASSATEDPKNPKPPRSGSWLSLAFIVSFFAMPVLGNYFGKTEEGQASRRLKTAEATVKSLKDGSLGQEAFLKPAVESATAAQFRTMLKEVGNYSKNLRTTNVIHLLNGADLTPEEKAFSIEILKEKPDPADLQADFHKFHRWLNAVMAKRVDAETLSIMKAEAETFFVARYQNDVLEGVAPLAPIMIVTLLMAGSLLLRAKTEH